MTEGPPPSLTGLLGQLAADGAEVLKAEGELLRAEIAAERGRMREALSGLLIGVGIAIAGTVVLLMAAVYALALVLPQWAAALIVGAAALATGAYLIRAKGAETTIQSDALDESIAGAKRTAQIITRSEESTHVRADV